MSKASREALARALMGKEADAPKRDVPGLIDDAARLAGAGRRGDKIIAHITPEEAALLKARGGSGTINPRTGLLEFFEGSTGADSHGDSSSGMSGADYGGGSAYGSDGGVGGMGDNFGYGVADAPAPAPGYQGEAALADQALAGARFAGPAEVALSDLGAVGRFAGSRVDNAINNPVATGLNTMASLALGPVGMANTISGLLGGPTIGGAITGAFGGGQRGGSQMAAAPSASGDEGSPLSGSMGGGGSGSGGPLSSGNPALASALLGNAQPGTPSNPFQRKTFGARVDSFDPNGRRYVSPWAYRG